MRFGQIRKFDVANGPGIRVSVFVVGCPLRCKGCFNEEYWKKDAGKEWTKKEEDFVIERLKLEQIEGLSILGGEPLAQDLNLNRLLKRAKEEVKKNIWLWSGFVYEELTPRQLEVLKYVDFLVDGPFISEKKDLNLRFKGSSNQRIIDLNKTRKENALILWDEET